MKRIENRITSLNMSGLEVLMAMSGGNVGAVRVLADIFKEGKKIDPDNALGGLGAIMFLDTLHIYEDRIWMLYKDVCGQRYDKMLAMLRAVQLGIVAEVVLNHAIDHHGEGLDLPKTLELVRAKLPNFKFVNSTPNSPPEAA